jgi:hypothetical protein
LLKVANFSCTLFLARKVVIRGQEKRDGPTLVQLEEARLQHS